jgi:transcriptional regulator with XRE-family HTH domain
MADIGVMRTEDWQRRLEAAIRDCGRSQREISLAAGLGPGYVHSILKEDKDPTIGNLLRVCRAADVSIYHILGGFEMKPEDEEFLKLLSSVDDDLKRSILLILERGRRHEVNPGLPDGSPRPRGPKRP